MKFDYHYEAAKRLERLKLGLVWRLPRWVAYWCFIRVAAYSSQTPQRSNTTMPDLRVMDALEDWGTPR